MKGKLRILGNIGLALFLLSALLVMAAPVSAATAVTNVWVDFEDANAQNDITATANVYLIHFKATTALKRGVDTVTVTWPDGSTAMGGDSFTVATAMAASEVKFGTNYESSAREAELTWTTSTVAPVVGGKRSLVTTPIDISAGQDVWVRFASNDITSASTVGGTYKVYVSTSKDTTPVLSSTFGLDGTKLGEPAVTISPGSAGASAEYVIALVTDVTTALVVDTDTVTIQFPVGSTVPSSISASYVQFSLDNSAYTSTGTTPTVDQDKRTITAVTSKAVSAGQTLYIKVTSAAGVTNPTEAASVSEALYKVMVSTSKDRQFKVSAAYAVTPGAAVAVKVGNGEIGLDSTYYSDDATMINMYSARIFVTMVDAYGNAKLVSGGVTVTPSASSGALYKNSAAAGTGTFSSASTLTVDVAAPDEGQTVYFRGATAGTHTLTFAASSYTDAEWTITVAPGVSLYDKDNNLIRTYGPTITVLAAELNTTDGGNVTDNSHVGVDYVTDAINGAMAGDTVKLGDGIYELATVITLNKKITLTSVNGASSTTLRPISDALDAIWVDTDGTATNPIIIDGLTFTRLRYGFEFDQGVYNNGYDYVTVRNNVFDYILPSIEGDHEFGSVVGIILAPNRNANANTITSATVSNNTFTNCITFTVPVGGAGEPGVIVIMTKASAVSGESITGVTVSGNTMTNSNGIGISINGYFGAGGDGVNESYVTADVTDNTITNPSQGISIQRQTHGVNVLRNTVTGAYTTGLYVEGYANADHDNLVIKNNTFTGIAGADKAYFSGNSAAIVIEADGTLATNGDVLGDTGANTIQYNAIYDNDATYSIKVSTAFYTSIVAQDAKYNWFGDATGPAYTALTGATIAKSNPNGAGKEVTDLVTYYPWLHRSLADVVDNNASYQAVTMKLVVGWNTLSTPVKLIAAANSIDELIPSGMEIGYYYDGGWQLITSGYVLNAVDAVYVKMSAITYVLLKFDAGAFSTPSKALAAGWNLVGLAYLNYTSTITGQMNADDAVASVAKTAANLPGYGQVVSPSMNATQTDIYGISGLNWAFSYGETVSDSTATQKMLAGLGYWVYMQNAATLAGFEITPIAPDLD